jgi:hypothetical protein
VIDYTGKTGTTFTGCTGVDHDHDSGEDVIQLVPAKDAVASPYFWAEDGYDWDFNTDYTTRLYNDDDGQSVDSEDLVYQGQTQHGLSYGAPSFDFSQDEAYEFTTGERHDWELNVDSLDDGRFSGVLPIHIHSNHGHDIDGIATEAGSAHNHETSFSISTSAKTFDNMKIAIDDGNGYVDKTTILENAAHLNRDLSTSSERGLDITEFLGDTPGKKGIKILGCRSDAGDPYIGNIFGILRAKYFETNRS